jgi:predicted nucleotidyltransferase
MISPKDFIETAEGLIFAVVDFGTEDHKILCFLRYVKEQQGWTKLQTKPANFFLSQYFPHYLHYSQRLDAHLHAVPISAIAKHHQPKQRLQQIIQSERSLDPVVQDLQRLCQLFKQHGLDLAQVGVTGSILIDVQNQASDIDIVCYDRHIFHQYRSVNRELIEQGLLQALNIEDWQAAYDRRSAHLSFAEYVWHEQRKYNKGMINRRKFDLSYVGQLPESTVLGYRKSRSIRLQAKVLEDVHAYDYPAKFKIEHEQISWVVSFTATYTGQAVKGEVIDVAGQVEINELGEQRIVVGSSREAHGEYIKVVGLK